MAGYTPIDFDWQISGVVMRGMVKLMKPVDFYEFR